MKHVDVLQEGRKLMERPDAATTGLWPRATALLARQALEAGLRDVWRVRAPGMEQCSTRAQLLCLPYYLQDEILAERVSYAWDGLSRACHQHPYDLPPTAMELQAWIEIVGQLLSKVATVVGAPQ